MENFLRIYSIVILTLQMIFSLFAMLKNDKKEARTASFITAVLFAPVFYYMIKF